MSLATRICQRAARQPQLTATTFRASACSQLSKISARSSVSTLPKRSRPFSTMSALKSNAPIPSAPREFDPEIKDIADYVHNYKIDSDLAVRNGNWSCERLSTDRASTTPPDTFSLTPSVADLRVCDSSNVPISSPLPFQACQWSTELVFLVPLMSLTPSTVPSALVQ